MWANDRSFGEFRSDFFSVDLFFSPQQFQVLEIIDNFAKADRLADHASRVRFSEPVPGLGLSVAGCYNIHLSLIHI